MYLLIDSIDYTKYAQESTYNVNSVDVENSWEDGNKITHTDVIRSRIEGNIELIFTTITEYKAFLASVRNATSLSGVTTVTVYVGGLTDEIKSIQCKVTIETAKQIHINNERDFIKLKMRIVEK